MGFGLTASETWTLGVSAMGAQGIREEVARDLIGLWLKDWDEETVQQAIIAALDKANVKRYTMGVLKNKKKKARKAQDQLELTRADSSQPASRETIEAALEKSRRILGRR